MLRKISLQTYWESLLFICRHEHSRNTIMKIVLHKYFSVFCCFLGGLTHFTFSFGPTYPVITISVWLYVLVMWNNLWPLDSIIKISCHWDKPHSLRIEPNHHPLDYKSDELTIWWTNIHKYNTHFYHSFCCWINKYYPFTKYTPILSWFRLLIRLMFLS